MIKYTIKNEDGKYLLIESGKDWTFVTPTLPFRQLIDTQKHANQVAVRVAKKKPELKGKLTIVEVVLNTGNDIEVEWPPDKEDE